MRTVTGTKENYRDIPKAKSKAASEMGLVRTLQQEYQVDPVKTWEWGGYVPMQ